MLEPWAREMVHLLTSKKLPKVPPSNVESVLKQICASLTVFHISAVDLVKAYRSHAKLCLFHSFASLCYVAFMSPVRVGPLPSKPAPVTLNAAEPSTKLCARGGGG